MKKIWWGAIVMLLIAVGCGRPIDNRSQSNGEAMPAPTAAETAVANNEPVELVIWAEFFTQSSMITDPEGAGQYGLYLKEQFEREHPGVTVHIEYHGWDTALQQNLFNALLAGTPPDIVVGENFFQIFADLDALVPLDEAITAEKENLIPGTYKAAELDGHIYGLSAFTGVFGFERNCAVLEAAGLDCNQPPQTWDDLLAEARQITTAGNGAFYGYTLQGPGESSTIGGIFRVAVYLAQAGVSLCRNECNEPYFNNPEAEPVLTFIRELHRNAPPGLAFNPDEGQVYEQLFRGLTAYQIAGSWHPNWAREVGCEDCRYSPIPVPENGRDATLVVGNVIYAVLQQSKHPDLAVEWVRFLARDDVQDLVYPSLGRLPSTRSALERLRPQVTLAEQAFIDQLLETPNLEILPQWPKEPQALWEIYNDLLADVLATERPILEIMDEAEARALRVLQP